MILCGLRREHITMHGIHIVEAFELRIVDDTAGFSSGTTLVIPAVRRPLAPC